MARVPGFLMAVALCTGGTPGAHADEVEFQDTPLLTSMWEATKDSDNDAIDRLLDSSEYAVKSRASDGRGLAWWAWEFKNVYVLGAIKAYGGDPMSTDEDLDGSTASSMCVPANDCDTEALMQE